jgi:hypothetical protein
LAEFEHVQQGEKVVLRRKKSPLELENERLKAAIAELQAREKARDKNFKPKHDFSQA